jgi:predicted alpha-1,2-mannosidase
MTRSGTDRRAGAGPGVRAVLLLVLLAGCTGAGGRPYDLVDPFIGTDAHGHTHPAATLPFGMVQAGPDTRLEGWDGSSGYHWSDSVVYGFSHTHLSGTGIPDYGDVLLMPTVGAVRWNNGADGRPGYGSRFSHRREQASPGYYAVHLDDPGVEVELTATRRAALHRYRFPVTDSAGVILDLVHRDPVTDASIRFVSATELEGWRCSSSWARDQRVFFVIRFSRPFDEHGIAVGDSLRGGIEEARGRRLKAFAGFTGTGEEPLLVKVGLSGVDVEGARRNLERELPGWDFEEVRAAAEAAWSAELGKVEVRGGSRARRRTFYTALYHAFLAPNLFSDTDGRYRGLDGQVHPSAGHDVYTVFSLWDTFRAAHPLYVLLQPERTADFIKTLLLHYRQGGRLPVWELAGNETDTMIGYHAVPVIVDAWMKGIRDFDPRPALEAMVAGADGEAFGLSAYRRLGYIPSDEAGESVSRTLEYAYDDWCIARFAEALGERETAARFDRRAQSWKNLYDPATGFLRAKVGAHWFGPFDAREVNANYTEANAWQYRFFVPHDLSGLMNLLGGPGAFADRLDSLFTAPPETTGREQADITGTIGQYAHGNEPSHHLAWLYDYAGQPWQTARRVREIADRLYSDRPDGLPGNEDCGQMSAWYVFAALGFYPVVPGSTQYALAAPLFPEVTLHLAGGRSFTLHARGTSRYRPFVRESSLDGIPLTRSWLDHAELLAGGDFRFRMSPSPGLAWGIDPADRSVSRIEGPPITPVPFVAAGERVFRGSTEVALGVPEEGGAIHFTLDGSAPTTASTRYERPFRLDRTTVVRMVAVSAGSGPSAVVSASFHRVPEDRTITLENPFAGQYSAGGPLALIDGIRGGEDFRTGTWQGYQGVDLAATVDLGSVREVGRLAAGFLQDVGSWIWMPTEVIWELSRDGGQWQAAGRTVDAVDERAYGSLHRDFTLTLEKSLPARWVRLRAVNRGTCPDWHPGAGGSAWLFADEIVIGP